MEAKLAVNKDTFGVCCDRYKKYRFGESSALAPIIELAACSGRQMAPAAYSVGDSARIVGSYRPEMVPRSAMMLTLTGLSNKGKQRIKTFGAVWRILRRQDSVLFSDKRGPWLLIMPEGRAANDPASRWIHGQSDMDFVATPITA